MRLRSCLHLSPRAVASSQNGSKALLTSFPLQQGLPSINILHGLGIRLAPLARPCDPILHLPRFHLFRPLGGRDVRVPSEIPVLVNGYAPSPPFEISYLDVVLARDFYLLSSYG